MVVDQFQFGVICGLAAIGALCMAFVAGFGVYNAVALVREFWMRR